MFFHPDLATELMWHRLLHESAQPPRPTLIRRDHLTVSPTAYTAGDVATPPFTKPPRPQKEQNTDE